MKKKQTQDDIKAEKCMEWIKEIRGLLCRPANLGGEIREACYEMIVAIDQIKWTRLHTDTEDLDKVRDRLTEIINLTNRFEGADLIIKGQKALEAAYRRLP